MTMLRLTALVWLAGCAGSGDGMPATSVSAGQSGVRGVAVADAGCPVLENASVCPQMPLRARIVATRTGSPERVGTVETGSDGRFEIVLAPGSYELRGENITGAPLPSAMPVSVSVRAGEFAQVKVIFDSGVRAPERST